jgi:hypothetical protein
VAAYSGVERSFLSSLLGLFLGMNTSPRREYAGQLVGVLLLVFAGSSVKTPSDSELPVAIPCTKSMFP